MIEKKADLILYNGLVYTVDKTRTQTQAVAILEDKIVFVGSNEGVESYRGSGTVAINLEGKMVLPGFVEAHAHPSQSMDLIKNINLHNLHSLEEYEKTILVDSFFSGDSDTLP